MWFVSWGPVFFQGTALVCIVVWVARLSVFFLVVSRVSGFFLVVSRVSGFFLGGF